MVTGDDDGDSLSMRTANAGRKKIGFNLAGSSGTVGDSCFDASMCPLIVVHSGIQFPDVPVISSLAASSSVPFLS